MYLDLQLNDALTAFYMHSEAEPGVELRGLHLFLSTFFFFMIVFPLLITTRMGGGGQGGLSLPLPVPLNPSSRPIFVGSHLCVFFSIAKFCAMLCNFPQFLLLPATLRIPLPAPCSPASHTPAAPFSPKLPPPCPPPHKRNDHVVL